MGQPNMLYSVIKITPNSEKIYMTADANQAWSKVYDIQEELAKENKNLNWLFDNKSGFRDDQGQYRAVFVELTKV